MGVKLEDIHIQKAQGHKLTDHDLMNRNLSVHEILEYHFFHEDEARRKQISEIIKKRLGIGSREEKLFDAYIENISKSVFISQERYNKNPDFYDSAAACQVPDVDGGWCTGYTMPKGEYLYSEYTIMMTEQGIEDMMLYIKSELEAKTVLTVYDSFKFTIDLTPAEGSTDSNNSHKKHPDITRQQYIKEARENMMNQMIILGVSKKQAKILTSKLLQLTTNL